MNKLPLKAEVSYLKEFLTAKEATDIYNHILHDYHINQYRININGRDSDFGKIMFVDSFIVEENRMPAPFYGQSFVWSEKMKTIKSRIEKLTNHQFQVCVCIYYPNGNSGVDFHYDPPAFGDTTYIPSLSLGEERQFLLREKETHHIHEIMLEEGSLLIMGDQCQELYEHCLPTDSQYKNGRINLTFRKYGF